jgi:dihydrofolate reductase
VAADGRGRPVVWTWFPHQGVVERLARVQRAPLSRVRGRRHPPFVNDLERPVGTYLYGRRMYEVMAPWETDPTLATQSPVMREFAELWQAADKVVYSRTLETASTARTRIERDFDPEAVRQLKATAGRDLTVGGPELAAQAIKAGLVDEFQLLLVPIIVGGGRPSLPSNLRLELELLDERRFGNGIVHLRYRTRT